MEQKGDEVPTESVAVVGAVPDLEGEEEELPREDTPSGEKFFRLSFETFQLITSNLLAYNLKQ